MQVLRGYQEPQKAHERADGDVSGSHQDIRRASCFMKSFPLDELRVEYLRDSHDITFFRCSNEDLIKSMSIPPQIIQEEMQNNWGIELQDLVSILALMILALSIAACPPAHNHKWSGKC